MRHHETENKRVSEERVELTLHLVCRLGGNS
jgi:hypothetical protein